MKLFVNKILIYSSWTIAKWKIEWCKYQSGIQVYMFENTCFEMSYRILQPLATNVFINDQNGY